MEAVQLALGGLDEIDTVGADSNPVETDITCNAHWVLPAIQEILDANPMLTFTAGDVYAACEVGAATLWTTVDGFVVTTGETDAFTVISLHHIIIISSLSSFIIFFLFVITSIRKS